MRKSRALKPALVSISAMALLGCMPVTDAPQIRPLQSAATAPVRDMLYESAISAIDKRDYARALDYLQQARLRDPRNPRVLNAMGVIYDKLGRFDLSARYYAQAQEADPASKVVANNMAYSKVLQGLSHQDGTNIAELPPTGAVTVASAAPVMTAPSDIPSPPVAAASQPVRMADNIPATQIPRPIARPALPLSGPQPVTVAAKEVPAVARSTTSSARSALPPPAVVLHPVITAAQASGKSRSAPETATTAHQQIAMPFVTSGSKAKTISQQPVPGADRSVARAEAAVNTAAAQSSANKTVVPHKAVTPDILVKPRPAGGLVQASTVGAKPVLTTGHPLLVIDATGHVTKAKVVGRRLTQLGWTVRATSAPDRQARTQLFYAPKDVAVARAMQNTLPFPVRATADASVAGLKLTIGQDFLSWKPRNARLAKLWQNLVVTALLSSSATKGAHP